MDKLYLLAPYFRAGFKGDVLICGFGSIQKKILDLELQIVMIKALEYLKKPRSLENIRTFINNISQDRYIKRTIYRYLMHNNWLMEAGLFNKKNRYSRNFLYYNLSGGDTVNIQNKLSSKHVIILGCGGIGNILSVSLATSGIGKLTLIDQDSIELSNLSRQFMFKESDIGKYKVEVLKKELIKRNKDLSVDIINDYVTEENLNKLPKADLIVLSADSYNILKIVTLHSLKYNIPIINVGYIEDIASWGPMFIPGQTGCFFCHNHSVDNTNIPDHLKQSMIKINNKYQAPSNGPINMLAASCALIDIIKFLGDFGKIYSLNKRIGIWTDNFKIQEQKCYKNINCSICSYKN